MPEISKKLNKFLMLSIFTALIFNPLSAVTASDITESDLEKLLQDEPQKPEIYRSLNNLISRIRDCRINRNTAKQQLIGYLEQIRKEDKGSGRRKYPSSEWRFPLEGYSIKSVTGGRRHGYISSGYDFYSGNRHGGHPSLDIFIRDKNYRSLDDRTGKPVSVLSITGGVVVATEDSWESDSKLRGGKYIWIYDPADDLMLYYAHNSSISVKPGDIVKPGDAIATVGRSGFNAAKRRSPTHLHLTVLKVDGGRMTPVDIYNNFR